jgi:hypothetical protein
MAEFKKIPIKCPKCYAIAFNYNGVTKMAVSTKCKECGCRLTYNPETNTVVKSLGNDQSTSSGKRFE